ncbi:MAG: glycosyltransferase family 4 protein [Deltaproteobacteria bacterium]|nr:glycosyltransferase family 4 protein [Candidatus Tharpella sp.]
MKLAFTLFKYFPYGGLQRDCLRIADLCRQAGAEVDIYAARLQGEAPIGVNFTHLLSPGFSHHRQYLSFAKRIQVLSQDYRALIGFNKMPGLDLYFAADPCYAATVKEKSWMKRLTSRYRTLSAFEQAVFAPAASTTILSISEVQRRLFQSIYGTPGERFHDLPPGVPADRLLSSDSLALGYSLRDELGIGQDELVVLMVGSGFKRKGVDRALNAMRVLPDELCQKSRLLVVGDDNLDTYRKLARRQGLGERVIFTGGRTDVPRFLAAADIFLHPAYQENTGGVLIEALAAGLPVLATAVCGYSVHIERARAGEIVAEPFVQRQLDEMLFVMLNSPLQRQLWSANAKEYVAKTDLFSLAERAAEIIMEVAGNKR